MNLMSPREFKDPCDSSPNPCLHSKSKELTTGREWQCEGDGGNDCTDRAMALMETTPHKQCEGDGGQGNGWR